MGRKSCLSGEEKVKSGLTRIYHCLVAKSVQNTGRSVCGVCHFLKNESNYGNNMKERITTCEIAREKKKKRPFTISIFISQTF